MIRPSVGLCAVATTLLLAGCVPAVRPTSSVSATAEDEVERRERAYLVAAADGYLSAYDSIRDAVVSHALDICEYESGAYDEYGLCTGLSGAGADAFVAGTRRSFDEALSLASQREFTAPFAQCLQLRVDAYVTWDNFLRIVADEIRVVDHERGAMAEELTYDLEEEREALLDVKEALEREREELSRRAGELTRTEHDEEATRIEDELEVVEADLAHIDAELANESAASDEEEAQVEGAREYLATAQEALVVRRGLGEPVETTIPDIVREYADPLAAADLDRAARDACRQFGGSPLVVPALE